jgi:hypothetical protein
MMRDLINILTENITKNELQDILTQNGYTDLKISGNKVAVLVQIPDGQKKDAFRLKVLQDLLNTVNAASPEMGATFDTDPKISSIGSIAFQGSPVRLLVKDVGVQGDKSSGVANEIELAGILQSVIEKYGSAHITFVDPRGKSLTINNCNKVDIAGRDVKGRKKADVVLISPNRNLPISIKKLNAEAWESADTLFGSKARNIIDQLRDDGILKLIKLETSSDSAPVFSLSKEIVVEPTEEEALNAIFGSDLNPQGGVVIQTFKPEHFVQDGNKVKVECHAVITTREEIPESHLMVWLLRNDSNRNSKALGIPGIRIMAVTLTRGIGKTGKKDVILVDQYGNVVDRNFDPSDEQDQEVSAKQLKQFDPEQTRVAIKPKGRRADPRDKDSTPRQKRDK